MKKITLLLFFLLSFIFIQKSNAKGVIVYHNGPQLELFSALPADAVMDDGSHVNIGIMYDQFGLFWMPLWNYSEPKYVLVSDDEKTYWEYTDTELQEIAKSYDISLHENPSPSLWNKIGLKPVLIILLLVVIWSNFPIRQKAEEDI